MVLVDTSIWVDHLRKGNSHLKDLLLEASVICHPFIIGELACGNMKNRSEILSLLLSIPVLSTINLEEYLFFIDQNKFYGRDLGFVDIHLLASAKLSDVPLWTADKRLQEVANKLDISYR